MDTRKLEGTKCIFNCSEKGNDLNRYNGLKCTVIKRVGNYDFDGTGKETVWVVEFGDGTRIDAFTEELIEI